MSATRGVGYVAMNEVHGKFGDHSGNLVAQIMSGTTFHKLIGADLANAAQLFQAQNVHVVDVLGDLQQRERDWAAEKERVAKQARENEVAAIRVAKQAATHEVEAKRLSD